MKQFKLLLLLLIPLFLTGCYDKREMDHLAYVIAIGVDKGSSNNVRITFQIAVPIQIAGEQGQGGKKSITLTTVEASSLYPAVSLADSYITKNINLSHNRVIIYSEEFARSGLSGYINAFTSNKELRPSVNVLISKCSAEDFLKSVTPILEINPAKYYDLIFSAYTYTNYLSGTELIDFYSNSQSIMGQPNALLVGVSPINSSKDFDTLPAKSTLGISNNALDGNYDVGSTPVVYESKSQFMGLAVFNGAKMTGELTGIETVAHQLVSGNFTTQNMSFPDVLEKEKLVVVSLGQDQKPKINVKLVNGSPYIDIKLYLSASIITSRATTDYSISKNSKDLEKAISREIENITYDYLYKTSKELKSDCAGIGNEIKKHFLTWDDLKKVNWLTIYPHSFFHVTTNITSLNNSQIILHTIPNEPSSGVHSL